MSKLYVVQEVHADIDKVIAVVRERDMEAYIKIRTEHYMKALTKSIHKYGSYTVVNHPAPFHEKGENGSFGAKASVIHFTDMEGDNVEFPYHIKHYAFYTEVELWDPK